MRMDGRTDLNGNRSDDGRSGLAPKYYVDRVVRRKSLVLVVVVVVVVVVKGTIFSLLKVRRLRVGGGRNPCIFNFVSM